MEAKKPEDTGYRIIKKFKMGLIKEPMNVDFFVVNKQMTEKEKKEFSNFIEEYKHKQALSKKRKQRKAA